MKLTNYYLCGSDQRLRLEKVVPQLRGRPKKLDKADSSCVGIRISPGIANSSIPNRQYKELLANLEIGQMDNLSIFDEYRRKYLICNDNDDIHIYDSSHSGGFRNRDSGESQAISKATQDIIIYLRIADKWSIPSLCSNFWVKSKK